MAKREGFTMNELNPRDKIIIDFLKTQFNKSDFIKDVLYEYIVSNNLQISTQPLQKNHITNTKKCIKDVSNVYKDLQKDSVKIDKDIIQVNNNIDTSTPKDNANNDNGFDFDLNSIGDEEVKMDTGEKESSATQNAMDYLLKL